MAFTVVQLMPLTVYFLFMPFLIKIHLNNSRYNFLCARISYNLLEIPSTS